MSTIRAIFVALGLTAGLMSGMVGGMMGWATPALALTPEEMLNDPVQEARARNLSQQVRCLVCQNQSIDDSDAELAQDLRRNIRQQIAAGTSDDKILDNLRASYGDFVLLNPPISPGTYVLWGTPAVILLGGAALVLANRRRLRLAADEGEMAGSGGDIEASDSPASDSPASDSPAGGTVPAPKAMSRFTMVMLGCGVLGVSLMLYLALGRPDLSDQPLAARQAEIAASIAQQTDVRDRNEQQLAAARAAVSTAPEKVESWLQLAVAARQTNNSTSEIAALRQALLLTAGDAGVKALLAEALSRAADGQITLPARQLIAEALIASPDEPRALYIAGLAAYQDEDFAKAVTLWQRLQSLSGTAAPWMALLADNIADAAAKAGIEVGTGATGATGATGDRLAKGMAISQTGGSEGPSAADMAAAAEMDSDDRLAMIEAMVAGLAERLQEDPQNPEGWQRLARAYDVLGRPQQAAAALIGAADALDSDADMQIAALEYIITNGLENGQANAIDRLLDRLDRVTPDGLERLFFRGHFAKETGDHERAKYFWQLLLERLPKDTPFASELKAEIADL